MNKIVSLRGEEIDVGTGARKSVVDLLRGFLEAAERGEIISVAIVSVDPAQKVDHHWSKGDDRHLLVAGAVYLQHELSKD